MPNESHEIELIISARDRARTVLQRLRGDFDSFARTARRVALVASVAFAAVGGAIGLLAQRGSEVESVATVFDVTAERLGRSSDELLDHLQSVTRDTVSSFQLMAQANAALGTGALTLTDFSTAIEFVGLKAKATGEDVDALTRKLVTGLLRGSVMLLDDALPTLTRELDRLNLDGMSPAERKSATLQVAFALMRQEMDTLRLTAGDTRDVMEQIGTTFTNLRDRLALIVAASPSVDRGLRMVREALEDAVVWVEANTDAVERWIAGGVAFVTVAVRIALATAQWVAEHAKLLAQLAAVGVILTLVHTVGQLVLAFTGLFTAIKALGTVLAITLGGGLVGIAVAGLAALALGASNVGRAFRDARIAMEGLDFAALSRQLRAIDVGVVTRPEVAGAEGVLFRRELEGARELEKKVRDLMVVLPARDRSLLESIIGRIEQTRDLERKVELLEILRARAIALANAESGRRDAEAERLAELDRRARELAKGGGEFTLPPELQALLDSGGEAAGGPLEGLSQRLQLLQAHFELGEESATNYKLQLLLIQDAARAAAVGNRDNAEAVIAAADVYRQATAALDALHEKQKEATESAVAFGEAMAHAVGEAIRAALQQMAATMSELFAALFGDAEGAEAPLRRLLAAVLDILGSMLIALGTTAIMTSTVIKGILAAVATLNPAAAIAVGLAAIATGALLKGASAAMMSSIQGGAGGGAPPAGGGRFRPAEAQEREPETIINVFVTNDLNQRGVAVLRKKLSRGEKQDVSLRIPITG